MDKYTICFGLLVIPLLLAGQAQAQISLDDIILGVESRESKIYKFECEFKITLPDHDNHVLSPQNLYRYYDGKEYCFEENFFPDDNSLREIFAWDNEKLMTYNFGGKDGTIRMPVGDEFYRQSHPLALFGWRVCGISYLNDRLSDHLRRSVNKKLDQVDYSGKKVYLVSGDIETEKDIPLSRLMVWVDIEKDFSPLKIELHYVSSQEQLEAEKMLRIESLSKLYRRIEILEYEYLDDSKIWFPMVGEDTYYTGKPVFKEGFDLNDVKGRPIEEQAKYIETIERVPMGLGTWRYEALNISIEPEFDDTSFSIDYPDDTLIYDEFTEIAYKVGSPEWEPGGGNGENEFDIGSIQLLPGDDDATTSDNHVQHDDLPSSALTDGAQTSQLKTQDSTALPLWILLIGAIIFGAFLLLIIFRAMGRPLS